MTIRSFKQLAGVAIATLGLAAFAAANPVSVTFGGGFGTPVNSNTTTDPQVYYPFFISVDGSQVTVSCDDIVDHVNPGETWTADVNTFIPNGATSVAGITGMTGGLFYDGSAQSLKNYEEAAFLFYQFAPVPAGTPNNLDPNQENAAINYAIWDIFNGGNPVLHDNAGDTTNESSAFWLTQASNNYTSLTADQIAGFAVYTPTNWDVATYGPNGFNYPNNGRPQELIGTTVPEPASLALLGTGLLGLAFLFKRRLHEGVDLDSRA